MIASNWNFTVFEFCMSYDSSFIMIQPRGVNCDVVIGKMLSKFWEFAQFSKIAHCPVEMQNCMCGISWQVCMSSSLTSGLNLVGPVMMCECTDQFASMSQHAK